MLKKVIITTLVIIFIGAITVWLSRQEQSYGSVPSKETEQIDVFSIR